MSTTTKKVTVDAATRKAVMHEACGGNPGDVLAALDSSSEVLSWIEEIFSVIEETPINDRGGFRIRSLAAVGAYLALGFSSQADEMQRRLRGGLVASGCVYPPDQQDQ